MDKRIVTVIIASAIALFVGLKISMAQGRIPANMVSVSSNGWTVLPSSTNLQGVLNFLDDLQAATVVTNYAALFSSGTNVHAITPRWKSDLLLMSDGDTVTQLWTAVDVTTNDWVMVYPAPAIPAYMIMSTNATATNTAPAFAGQFLGIANPQTNILWWGTNTTSASWKQVFGATP